MKYLIALVAVLSFASPALAQSHWELDWTLRGGQFVQRPSGFQYTLTGSSPAILTPVPNPPPDFFGCCPPGAPVFDLSYLVGTKVHGGLVTEEFASRGNFTAPIPHGGGVDPQQPTDTIPASAFSSFTLSPDGSSFFVDVNSGLGQTSSFVEFSGKGVPWSSPVFPAFPGSSTAQAAEPWSFLFVLGGFAALIAARRRTVPTL